MKKFVCKSAKILLNILNCGYFNLEGTGVPPFAALLGLLSDPLLALFVLQGDKVPVVINQKVLGENIRNKLKRGLSQRFNITFCKSWVFSNTLIPIVSPSLR